MTENGWLECTNPVVMLDHVASRISDRQCCLIVAACMRSVDAWPADEVERLERDADGEPDDREWDVNLFVAARYWTAGKSQGPAIVRDIVDNPFRPVELSLCEGCYGQEEHGASGNANWKRSECPRCFGVGRLASWLTPTVLSLAQAAYDTRQPNGTLDPLRLSVLADALEEAGCDNSILSHLRSPGPHWRGCHVVDLILGKE